jgi:hydroxypyruvate isomerase
MPRLAANIKYLFTEIPFEERFEAAARAGFKGVEYQTPYEHDRQLIKDKLAQYHLQLVLINLPPGTRQGDRGIVCHPDRTADFERTVELAIECAQALNCPQANCTAGAAPGDADPARIRNTYIRNLKHAAARFKEAGFRLVIEALNTRDVPGSFLNRSGQAFEIIDAVGADNLFFQYDVYHMQIMEGDLAHTIEKNVARIGHMQIADTPGRHEPGSGEINFYFLLPFIDAIGYDGWIGCEYQPAGYTQAGLAWARRYLKAARDDTR